MSLRIVFFGSDPIALPLLEWLSGEGTAFGRLVAVYTQPDRPVGRGQKVQPNGIKLWAQTQGIPVFQPEKITEATQAGLQGLECDLGLVMAYGHLLKDAFIATPRLGMVNFHASLLPAYRGASPIQTAVAQGEGETGVSLMRIVRELDAGPVGDVERVAIRPRETALDIERKLSLACVPLLSRNLPQISSGALVFKEQDRSRASFCRKLTKEDGMLDFRRDARLVAARINGLYPWPACSFAFGGQSIKVGLADPLESVAADDEGLTPGTVLGSDGEGLLVSTALGRLRLLRLQRSGGKMLPASEFLRGLDIPKGALLPSADFSPLVADHPFPRAKK